jgi:DNA-binding NarL/FixJ family response regulator
VVDEAKTGREALNLCRTLRPDLVLMDVRMPEMGGLMATRAIKAGRPSTSVLILELLIQGHSNQEIARYLTVSLSTVKTHIQHIIAKLEVSDRTQAAVRAIRLGLFPS